LLEIVGHERLEFLAVFGRDLIQTAVDRGAEFGEGVVVAAVEHVSFDELPQAFDEVEVGRIRRQELQLDVERRRQVDDQRAVLIAGVVEHQGDRSCQAEGGDLAQQFTHRVRRHRAGGRDADKLIRHGVPGSQHAVALAARGPSNEQALQTPQTAQERALDEMSCVDEEDVTCFGSSGSEQRLQCFVEKLGLCRGVLFDGFFGRQRDCGGATPLQAQTFFKKCRT